MVPSWWYPNFPRLHKIQEECRWIPSDSPPVSGHSHYFLGAGGAPAGIQGCCRLSHSPGLHILLLCCCHSTAEEQFSWSLADAMGFFCAHSGRKMLLWAHANLHTFLSVLNSILLWKIDQKALWSRLPTQNPMLHFQVSLLDCFVCHLMVSYKYHSASDKLKFPLAG